MTGGRARGVDPLCAAERRLSGRGCPASLSEPQASLEAGRHDSPERGKPAGPGQRGAFLWVLSCRAARKKLARRGETRQAPNSSLNRRNPLQQRKNRSKPIPHLAAIDDHVDGALFEQKLGTLEALGQLLAHRLLDDARAGEADQRAGLGDDDIADEGEGGRDAAHGRVGEDGDEGSP